MKMHYHVREKARRGLGEAGTPALVVEIVESLRQELGEKLAARLRAGVRGAAPYPDFKRKQIPRI
jgi:hypothetical protein